MRNALPTGDSPRYAPTRTAGVMRLGPTIEPIVEPHTMSPIARPRLAAGVMSAAA